MGRLIECLEYMSFRLVPSSETADSCTGYRSAEEGRPTMDMGGDWSTMAGSP